MDTILVYIPCKSADEAKIIANELIRHRLIACANLLPQITSWYRWEGEIVEDIESLLLCKTTQDHFEAVRALVCSLHSYSLPAIVAYPAVAGHAPYLDWVQAETH